MKGSLRLAQANNRIGVHKDLKEIFVGWVE